MILIGEENYANEKEFGKPIFDELKDISQHGLTIDGIRHEIDVISCCDWKVQATIEGTVIVMLLTL